MDPDPLRLRDGQFLWGRDILFDGTRYRVDVETAKDDEPLRGALNEVLTLFLDALVLRGLDPAWLGEMRRRTLAEGRPVFADVTGRLLARGYPSSVWRRHFGTGSHISRVRVHTEPGRLGPEGAETPLRSPRSAIPAPPRTTRAGRRRSP